MNVIYTITNPADGLCYVGYTDSFAKRMSQHVAKGLFSLLKLPVQIPLWVLMKTGKLIIDVFLTNDKRGDEIGQISKMRESGYKMINKTAGGNGR